WRLDEFSGNAIDSSLSGLHLSALNNPLGTAGQVGIAREFAGNSLQHLIRSGANVAPLQFGDSDFTIAGWFRPSSFFGGEDHRIISRHTAANTQQWGVYANPTDVRFSVSNDGTDTGQTVVVNAT